MFPCQYQDVWKQLVLAFFKFSWQFRNTILCACILMGISLIASHIIYYDILTADFLPGKVCQFGINVLAKMSCSPKPCTNVVFIVYHCDRWSIISSYQSFFAVQIYNLSYTFSRIFTFCEYFTKSQSDQPPDGSITQLQVEHRTSIAEVMGSNPVQARSFLGFIFQSCLSLSV